MLCSRLWIASARLRGLRNDEVGLKKPFTMQSQPNYRVPYCRNVSRSGSASERSGCGPCLLRGLAFASDGRSLLAEA
jgi:hypothetical protein